MKPAVNFYIALGSNEGDRIAFLQQAGNEIDQKIGGVQKLSQIYDTPAWGFEGNAFLNACIQVKSRFEPAEVLKKLLEIENKLGRVRGNSKEYSNRCIDLDILFVENEIVNTTTLQIPHPQIEYRKFVLQPLADIVASMIHPVLNQKISQLLKETMDYSPIEEIGICLQKPGSQFNFTKCNYIAIEGNIGAGKTSLATMISQDLNAKLILERFKDNPFLPKFYEDRNRYAFPLEMSFLADRYQQLSDDLAQYDLFSDFVVSDYDVFKSLIFAKITLHEDEYALYDKLFRIMYKELIKPDLYIYLYQNTDRLLENIRHRGRSYEQNIDAEYLMDINKSYLNFIKSQTSIKVKVIDISSLDFVNNREDYLFVLQEIDKVFLKNN